MHDEILTLKDLINRLEYIRTRTMSGKDEEDDHIDADKALLEFIGDPEVTEAFHSIRKWYS